MSLKKKKDLKQLLKIAEQRKFPKANSSKKLSLCLIAKNEEKNIARCLESVQGVVDEIIVLDTGSTDKTIDIAKNYNAKIFYSEWKNDFAASRNEAIEKATGDWILILDADEELKEESKGKIRFFMVDIDIPICYTLRIKNLTENNDIQLSNFMTRFFKNHPDLRFKGKIHETIDIQNKVMITEDDVHILHHGYKDSIKNYEKTESRNNPIIDELLNSEDIKDNYKSYLKFYVASNSITNMDYTSAVETLKESIKLLDIENKKNYDIEFATLLYLKLAFSYILAKEYEASKNFLLESKEKLPALLNTYEYWYNLGYIHLMEGKNKESLDNFIKSKELFENKELNYFRTVNDDFYYYSVLLCIANSYYLLEDINNTIKALDNAFESSKSKYFEENHYMVISSLYVSCNDLEKALSVAKYAESISKREDNKHKIMKYISNISLRLNKFYDAILYQSKIHDSTTVRENWYVMAKSLEDEKQFQFSEEVYSAIIEVLPDEVEAYLGRCVSRLIQNKTILALEDLAIAKKKSILTESKIKVAMLYLQVSQPYQSKTILEDVLKEEPENYDANLYKASLEQSEGNIIGAKNTLKQLIDVYPEDTRGYLQLANLLLFNQENDDAIYFYNKVISKEKDNAYVMYALSLCYLNKGDKDKALDNINKALEIQPENESLSNIKKQILSVSV